MIAQTPWVFLVWTAVITGAAWVAVNHLKSNQISDLTGRLALRDDEISDYRRKLSGASPDEAKARIDGLESRIDQLMPRRVTAGQREQIRAALSGLIGHVSIGSDMACADAPAVAAALAGAFTAAGWSVQNHGFMGLANPPLSGLGVRVPNPNNLTGSQASIVAALRAADLVVEIQPGGQQNTFHQPGAPVPDAEIVITPRVLD